MNAKVKIIGDDVRYHFPACHKFSKWVALMLEAYHVHVCDRYAQGVTMTEIAATDGTTIPRIRGILVAKGIDIKKQGSRKQAGPTWEADGRAAYQNGERVRDIAACVGVSKQRIYQIAKNRNWKRLSFQKSAL